MAKLNEQKVAEIKALLADGKCGAERIAKSYGVNKKTVQAIGRGDTWRHVTINNHIIDRIEWLDCNEPVYDIEVEHWNNFIANEICVHNSSGTDPWDRGFNIQTIPRGPFIKQMFLAPDGWSFIEVDLRQAESRFVAYDAADPTLIDMLESGADVHTYVTNEILSALGKDPKSISKEEFKNTWRQLGKKSGHGANYAMKANVFVETCFNEMDIILTKHQAQTILDSYYRLFPGIPRWHAWIRRELGAKRKLSAPSGWERYFYGRVNDEMHKQGYAWRPQHTIPWVTNHLMLYLLDQRKNARLTFKLLVQVHDSLILLAPTNLVAQVVAACFNYSDWHPEIQLSGGRLVIPVECKAGVRMSELEDIDVKT